MPVEVRIPQSGGRNSQGYTKLIERVDASRHDAFAFSGRFLKPGSLVDESAIRPPGWPDPPLLLEYVPPEGKAHGWRAHEQAAEHILWAWVSKTSAWRELGRATAAGGDNSWVQVLKPLALAHIAPPPLVWRRTLAEARERIVAAVDAELEAVEGGLGHRSALLSIVHDVIASRAALFADPVSGGSFFQGQSVGKNTDRQNTTSITDFSLLSLPYIPARNTQPTGGKPPSGVWVSDLDSPSGLGELLAKRQVESQKELAKGSEFQVESPPVASTKITAAEREVMRKLGSIGGKKGSASLTPEQRRERALRANAARLAKRAALALQAEKPSA